MPSGRLNRSRCAASGSARSHSTASAREVGIWRMRTVASSGEGATVALKVIAARESGGWKFQVAGFSFFARAEGPRSEEVPPAVLRAEATTKVPATPAKLMTWDDLT